MVGIRRWGSRDKGSGVLGCWGGVWGAEGLGVVGSRGGEGQGGGDLGVLGVQG